MPRITVGEGSWTVPDGSNLLDALNAAGKSVPFSCRAGSCQVCLVRCVQGQPLDARPDALDPARRLQGWRLACQCTVNEDLYVKTFSPTHEGQSAHVVEADWLAGQVLRLRLMPERPLRYHAGQHLSLWGAGGIARPYSLASLPGADPWLEFHLDCSRCGAFCDLARSLRTGDSLSLGQPFAGALHYDPQWQERPLLLLAAGTGLAPLWGVLREALRQGHAGPIRLLHFCRGVSYLQGPLQMLVERHGNLTVELIASEQARARIQTLETASRKEVVLICGAEAFVGDCAKRLFMTGVPRGQVFSDSFLSQSAGT